MIIKQLVTFGLLAFVVVSIGVTLSNSPTSSGGSKASAVEPQLTVYYFHGTTRCPTCRNIERLTTETLAQHFAQKLEQGEIQFRSVNLDETQNEHYLKKFQLDSRPVVLAHKSGSWKSLEEVWELAYKEDDFLRFMKEQVEQFVP